MRPIKFTGETGMTNGEKPEKTMFDRESARRLLCEYTSSESLRKHALAVEACMRAYARKFHGAGAQAAAAAATAEVDPAMPAGAQPFLNEEEKWGITGLLHDFDYEKYPNAPDPARGVGEETSHPFVGVKILEERGYPEEIRRAILSHADYSGVKRETLMERTLFACDELAGFITATALVKPNKSLAEVEAKSVRKKMKDKAFARSVNRDDIVNGAKELGIDLEEHIAFCIEAMKAIAKELGLAGNLAPQQ